MELRDNGLLVHEGIVIGKIEDTTITLNLGWMSAAGVHVKILGDPDVEKRRVILDR